MKIEVAFENISICFPCNFISVTGYVGCFNDKKLHAMPHKHITDNKMTVEMCTKHCKSSGYLYAGVEVFTFLFCLV